MKLKQYLPTGLLDLSRPYARLTLLAAVVLALYLLGLAFNVTPWLRGPEEWRWNYALPGTLARLWLPALLLIGYVFVAHMLHRRSDEHRYRVLALIVAMAMTPALQLSLLYMDHPDVRTPLFYRTVSESSGGFFNVGSVVSDTDDLLRHFVERMPDYPVHPQRHPPGLPLLFGWTHQFFEQNPAWADRLNDVLRPYQCHNLTLMNLSNASIASATLQMGVPFLLGVAVWLIYALGRTVYDPHSAMRAALLWPLLPSIALWATRWNQVYALFTLLSFLALHHALQRRRLAFFYLSGLIVSIASFFSLGNFALFGFLGIYAIGKLLVTPERPRPAWVMIAGGVFAVGLATVWIIVLLAHGLNLLDLWRTAISTHLGLGRSYTTWLFFHLYDFFVFFGIPLFIFWLVRTVRVVREARARVGAIDVFALAFALGIVLLDLSGTSQGEVARVWAFLLPLPLLIAVRVLPKHSLAFVSLTGLLALQVFVSNIFLRPVGTGLSDPPLPPPVARNDATTEHEAATWDAGIVLQNAQVPADANGGDTIPIRVTWSTERQVYRPYTVFVHLIDAQGQLVAQQDGMPLQGHWLTTCWQAGDQFEDVYSLTLPQQLVAQEYQVILGLYWLPNLERLTVSGSRADSIELGSISVH